MDIPALAEELVRVLSPALPFLLKVGEKAAEEIGKRLGSGMLDRAREIWDRLRGHPDVEKAAHDLASMPDDPDAQAALRLQLRKLLQDDPALAQELAQLREKAAAEVRTVSATADRSVATGGDVIGSVIVTGDRNRIDT